MIEKVTLEDFGALNRHFHIYGIHSSALDHMDHYHDYYQVCYVVSGEIIHRKEKDTVTLRAGDAFIVPPGFVHSLHFENVHSEMYSLSFAQNLFPPEFSQSNAYQFLSSLQQEREGEITSAVHLRMGMDKPLRQSIEDLMKCLIRQQESKCPVELSAAPSLVMALLNLLSQSYYLQPQNYEEYQSLTEYSNTMHRCVQYVDQHYKEDISSDKLVRMFGISRSVFFSTFPHFAGMPLRKYIANKRILEAQILMRAHPNLTISQIAVEVGYEDDSTFYRNFVAITGTTPSKYKSCHK